MTKLAITFNETLQGCDLWRIAVVCFCCFFNVQWTLRNLVHAKHIFLEDKKNKFHWKILIFFLIFVQKKSCVHV